MTPVCPRCPDSALVTSSTHGVWVMYCARCWGLWVDHDSVRHVAGVAIDGATAAHGDAIACPICRAGLRAWGAKGIVIDRCDAHGVWFDRSELDQLVAHSRAGHASTGGPSIAGGVAVAVAGAAVAAGVGTEQRDPQASRWDSAEAAVDAVDVALPVVDSGGEILAGAGEVAVAGVEAVGGVAEVGAEAAGGVFEAVGAIFDFFS